MGGFSTPTNRIG